MYKVGDTILFGRYFQNNLKVKTDIEWKILEVLDGKMLITAQKALDAIAYNEQMVNTTWETSSIRKWLNNTFINTAFETCEISAIIDAKVINLDNKNPLRTGLSHNPPIVPGGNNTVDKVFLLSIEEVKKYFKIIDEQDQALISDELYLEPTLYSKNKDVYCPGNDGAWWWLRSPGNTSRMAVTTMQRKAVWFPGAEVDDKTFAIRPAMWIDINFEKIIIERRKAEEEARRKAEEEARRKAEEEAKRKAEEETKRKAEEEAKRKAEKEAKRKAEQEAKRKAEEEVKRKAEKEAKRKAEEEAKRKAKENKIRENRKAKNLCQHCGGSFKGIFIKKCRQCNKRKDY